MSDSKGHRGLIVYQKSFELAMQIFRETIQFPKEEKFSLIDQMRRSSRAVCSAIAEAYRKRMYEAYFVNKLTDADSENSETLVWLEFAESCSYMTTTKRNELEKLNLEIGRMLNSMIENPEKFLIKKKEKN